ncbi:MAG: hypothetical protein HND52_14095 [Ignavibacteriae bacterium]|nr:hypothetical protein [Ignavibacteriota bacterium]
MKNLKKLFLLLLIFSFASVLFASENTSDRTKSFNVSKGGTLFAKADPGNIIVDTWDQDEVKVELVGSNDADLDEVSFKQNGNQIYVTTRDLGWNESIDFYVKVPANFHLQLETTAGNLELSNDIIGRASLYSAGGNIQTRNVQGELRIKTMGGNILTGDISGKLSVDTRGGNIQVGEIKGESAQLKTMGGNISVGSSESNILVNTYGGEISLGNVGGSATAKTYGGNISMQNVEGNVTADTYGGSISVEAANGKVDVKTNGGNIDLKNIKGSVRAVTSAGNIYVELNPSRGGESLIKTSVGEIELLIPETAQATINAKIDTYTKWDRDGYDIVSDFPESTINEGERGIKKVFKLNSGKHEIRLKTTSSDIRIKKMK